MALTLSGRLQDPYGNELPGASIRFQASRTGAEVIANYSAEAVADAQGDYSISVRYGTYHISARQSESDPWYTIARNIPVTPDTTSESVNDLIVAFVGEGEATPEIVVQIEAIRNEAIAAANTSEAHADRAEGFSEQAAGFASDARSSAQEASATYESTSSGLAATSDRQFFTVPESGYLQLYQNIGGSALPVLRMASQEAVEGLSAKPDPILMSLIL
jgi:hypothetical protein